jgi:hypothetical protein
MGTIVSSPADRPDHEKGLTKSVRDLMVDLNELITRQFDLKINLATAIVPLVLTRHSDKRLPRL